MTAGRNNSDSLSKHWCTPLKYKELIFEFFGGSPDLDPCSNKYSIINARVTYSFPDKNGLVESWEYGKIFVNPPYGKDKETKTSIKDWLRLCHNANLVHNSEVLALIPVATNTSHWKNFVFGSAMSVSFLGDTRLKFMINGVESAKGAPMACAMVYWGNDHRKFNNVFSSVGAVVRLR